MGRCNNRRSQQRAEEERNVPSRARFSKGPPNKKGGRGRGRGRGRGDQNNNGRGGGRGGRSNASNDAVVQKIQNRVQQQRKDLGGISIVKTSANTKSSSNANANNINSITRKSTHELNGIDVTKLDTITLSVESVAIVERLLRAYNVWEEGDDSSDEKKSGSNEKKNTDTYDDGDMKHEVVASAMEMETEQISSIQTTKYDFGIDQSGEQHYDDYGGDYDDEPAALNDGITFNHMDPVCDYDTSDESDSNSIDEDGKEKDDEEDLMNSTIFRHLTHHFSFQQQEVILALRASRKRLRIAKKKAADEAEDGIENNNDIDVDEITKEDEGSLLEMSMDWLSLHLKESDLRKGFRVQKISKPSSAERTFSHEASFIKAVPHESLSVMPKLTQSQYEKETKETLAHFRKQNLMTDQLEWDFTRRK